MESPQASSPSGSKASQPANDLGVERSRSIFSATRSGLSSADERRDTDSSSQGDTLLQRLPDARLALRCEAILDAFTHMGKEVTVREYPDHATAGLPAVFAAVRPGSEAGTFEVGVALSSAEHEELEPCLGEWPHHAILSKFVLHSNETLSGRHLRWIRLASRAMAKAV